MMATTMRRTSAARRNIFRQMGNRPPPFGTRRCIGSHQPTRGESMQLPDGRRMGFFQSGAPNGTPVVYIHGTPDSGVQLCGKLEDETAKRLGIRWIGPDRPGIGLSTHKADRTVLDYPADLERLLDHLELDSTYLLGTSGGAGYTLAAALRLPRERLLGVGICAGLGPIEAGLEGVGEAVKRGLDLWREQPAVVSAALEESIVPLAKARDLDGMKEALRMLLGEALTGRDRDAILSDDALTSAAKGWMQVYMQGAQGHAKDIALNLRPWGFSIEDVEYSGVKLWYGSRDDNTPPQMGRYMAKRLPEAVYREFDGESHYTIWLEGRLDEMLKDLLARSRASDRSGS